MQFYGPKRLLQQTTGLKTETRNEVEMSRIVKWVEFDAKLDT
jgi:hypothetical protein